MKKDEKHYYIEDDFGADWTEEVENAMWELKEKLDLPTEEVERTLVARTTERRKTKRFEIRVPILTTNGNRITETFTSDMNYNGCFIETESPCQIGDKIRVSLQTELRGIGGLLQGPVDSEAIEAIVRWTRAKSGAVGEYAGMGVEFINMTQNQKDQVERVLLISETETLMSLGC